MNLVAHFYLDQHHPEPLFAVGAATPDLLSIYNNGIRLKQRNLRYLSPEQTAAIPPAFLAGLNRHFFADGIFHTSELFHRLTKRVSNMLVEYFPQLKVERKFFVGHILLELLLDKVLINRHAGILTEYYDHYAELQPFTEIRVALETALGKPVPNYEEYLSRFLDKRWLYAYADYEHIVWILARILQRVRLRDLRYLHSQDFTRLMSDFEVELIEVHEQFFTEIRAAE